MKKTILAIGILAASGFAGAQMYADSQTEKHINQAIQEIKEANPDLDIAFAEASYSVFSNTVKVEDVTLSSSQKEGGVFVEEVLFTPSHNESGDLAKEGFIELKNAHLTTDLIPKNGSEKDYQEMVEGFEVVAGDDDIIYLSAKSAFGVSDDMSSVSFDGSVQIENIGKINISTDLSNIKPILEHKYGEAEALTEQQKELLGQQLLLTGSLENSKLSFESNKIFDTLTRYGVNVKGFSSEEMDSRFKKTIKELKDFPGNTQDEKEIVDIIEQAYQQNRDFIITVSLKDPVNFSSAISMPQVSTAEKSQQELVKEHFGITMTAKLK